jgi:antitoxin HigA-1
MMTKHSIDTYKGIHPGKVINQRLKQIHQSQRAFARTINEHSQTINAVIMGRRSLTTELSVKIERALGFEEGFLLTLQAYYNVAEYKRMEANATIHGVPTIRKSVFWDTDVEKMDWGRYRNAIVQRVLERGNETEKVELARFYGMDPMEMKVAEPQNAYRIRPKVKKDGKG